MSCSGDDAASRAGWGVCIGAFAISSALIAAGSVLSDSPLPREFLLVPVVLILFAGLSYPRPLYLGMIVLFLPVAFLAAHGTPGPLPGAAIVIVALLLVVVAEAHRRHTAKGREAEQAVRRSEALFRAITENTADVTVVIDQDGIQRYVSPSIAATSGYTPEEATRKSFEEFIHPDDLGAIQELFRVARNTPRVQLDIPVLRVRHRDGRWMYMEGKVTDMRDDPAVHGIVANCRDITERLKVDEELRRAEAAFRELFDEAPVAYHELDTEGRIVRVNKTETEMLGYTADEMLGHYVWDFVVDPERSRARFCERMAHRREGPTFERTLRRKDGTTVPMLIEDRFLVDGNGELTGLRSVLQDITARKQQEEKLRESEGRFRLLAENIPGIVYLCKNDERYRMIYLNDHVETLTGYPKEDFLEDRISLVELFHPEDSAGVFEGVDRALEEEEPYFLRYRVKRSDGEWRWVEEYGGGVYGEDGALLYLEGLIQDVTETRIAREERRKLEAQMQHAQKLESLGVLAGGIAHDFNNLLTGVLGNVGLARMDTPAGSPANEFLEGAETAARRAADLCRQMLAYSGKGRFVIKAVDLSGLVREMLHLLEVSISKKVALKCHLDDNLPATQGDATQLRQVVMNLITNASDAIGEQSGAISLRTGVMDCDTDYLSETYLDDDLPEGPYVYIEVTDTGIGMGADTQAKLFDPFFTTKFAGRGLGLAAALGIVRGHRGAIKVYSEVGHGTSFKVLFPAVSQPAEPEEEQHHFGDIKGEGTVLVIDDEKAIRDVARNALERCGFQVLTAVDGQEGVDLFRENAEGIVLVLLDMTMPRMGGDEAFRGIRRIRGDVPVVLSSGYNEREAIERFSGEGLAGFLQKPYQAEQLLDKLGEVLSGG
ncbi:MAG: PAS domain S-box protein [Nitrospiraceae bacterium]|nr:PAS domain S-box protein [Nitrospiraceae bacterium]